jgi:hypothetical protein
VLEAWSYEPRSVVRIEPNGPIKVLDRAVDLSFVRARKATVCVSLAQILLRFFPRLDKGRAAANANLRIGGVYAKSPIFVIVGVLSRKMLTGITLKTRKANAIAVLANMCAVPLPRHAYRLIL